jgi:alpha-N-arabinofuranosidase
MFSRALNWLILAFRMLFSRFRGIILSFLFIGISPLGAYTQTILETDASCVIKEVSHHPVSINLNYLTDGEYLNPQKAIEIPLKKMGVKFLRYPGGEKSDNYFWSVPPFQGVDPHFALRGNCTWPNNSPTWSADFNKPKEYILDFDEFVTLYQKIQAEPFIVVPGDPQRFNNPGCTYYPSLNDVADVAKEWVRYANEIRDLGIKYWMVGNESWNSAAYDNGVSAFQYRNDFKVIAAAMKSVDSTIKIVANTREGNYANVLLQDPVAVDLIDYLAISNYSISDWSTGYDYYINNTPSFVGKIESILSSIDQHAPDSDIEVIVSEFNAIDWGTNGWSNAHNDLGHALVVFQILGDHLEKRRLHNSFYWNTRWINESIEIYNGIDFEGNLNATGTAISIWGNFLLDKLISSGETDSIRTFATKSDDQKKLNIFLLNKTYNPQVVDFTISQFLDTLAGNTEIKLYEFSGNSIFDVNPSFEQIIKPYSLNGNQISLDLPPTSVTVISIEATQPTALSNLCPNNLITENGGFESGDFQGWDIAGNTALDRDAYHGGYAARLKGLGSFAQRAFEINEGDSCRIHAFAKRIDATTTGTINIRFIDANEELIAERISPFNLSHHYEAYDFASLAPPHSKKVEVRFFNNHNQGTIFLDDVCVMIENKAPRTTSLDELLPKRVTAFPNPTNGNLTVEFEPNHPFRKLSIFDLNGALISEDSITEGIPKWEISLQEMPAGLYMLQVSSTDAKEMILVRKD